MSLTILLNSLKFSSKSLAAFGFAGELIFGSLKRIIRERITVLIFIIGDHLFCSTSRHILPFSKILGWKTNPAGKLT